MNHGTAQEILRMHLRVGAFLRAFLLDSFRLLVRLFLMAFFIAFLLHTVGQNVEKIQKPTHTTPGTNMG